MAATVPRTGLGLQRTGRRNRYGTGCRRSSSTTSFGCGPRPTTCCGPSRRHCRQPGGRTFLGWLGLLLSFRGKAAVVTLVELPLVLPPAAAGIALLAAVPVPVVGGAEHVYRDRHAANHSRRAHGAMRHSAQASRNRRQAIR